MEPAYEAITTVFKMKKTDPDEILPDIVNAVFRVKHEVLVRVMIGIFDYKSQCFMHNGDSYTKAEVDMWGIYDTSIWYE